MTKVGLVQLGCAKNQVDGEEMLGALAGFGPAGEGGVQFVADKRDADVLIVNTCGFIGPAKEESINAILDAVRRKERGQVSKVIVTGCLAQRYGAELAKEIPEVDAFLGIESAPAVGNVVFGARPASVNLVEQVAEKYPLVPRARLRATATPGPRTSRFPKAATMPAHSAPFPVFAGGIGPSLLSGWWKKRLSLPRRAQKS